MNSLKRLILFSIITLTFLGAVVFFLASIRLSNLALRNVYSTDLENMIGLMSQTIEEENSSKIELLSAIANLPFIYDDSLSMEEKQIQLNEIATHNKSILDITIADTMGMIKRVGKRQTSISNRNDFIDANNGRNGVFGPVKDVDIGKLILYYSVPVFNKDKKVVNVISIAVDGGILTDFCQKFLIGGFSHPFIIDRYTSVILGDNDPARADGTHLLMNDAFQSNYDGLSDAIYSFASTPSEIYTYKINKKTIYLPYSQIANTSWGVCASIPQSYLTVNTRALRLNMIILAFMLLTSGIIIAIVVSKACTPLRVLGTTISDIGSGNADLTTRLQLKHVKREIANVVNGFNSFVEKLHAIVTEVNDAENKLTAINEDLQLSAEDTSSSITQIIANIQSVSSQISNESLSVEATAGAINEITANIESLERMIGTQAENVIQASAAVEQMVANIDSVNNSVNIMVSAFQSLENNTKLGIATQNELNERLQRIDEQSKMLQEANTVISSIAEQTNLLAMNAAIEAAHAGDAGKGFSVVADEIRKLSETSSTQSEEIGKELNEIQKSIAIVVESSEKTSKAFTSVSSDIERTDQVIHSIMLAMDEQQAGSKLITYSLSEMNDSTSQVNSAAKEMADGSKHILSEVQSLQNATMVMNDSISEMAVGAQKINESGAKLSDITKQVSQSVFTIHKQIGQFKI